MSTGNSNFPPGLECLTTIDKFYVRKELRPLELFSGFDMNNRYTIMNSAGQNIYFAAERNDCCTRNCLGSGRPFDMDVMDSNGNAVISLYRPLACSACCCPCWLQSIDVYAPFEDHVGRIEQEWSMCFPRFRCKNAAGDVVLRIEGPCSTLACYNDVMFKIVTLNGIQVGEITKQWEGMILEMFTDVDFFVITFPIDLDVLMKATLLGACFLIDAMYFERRKRRRHR